MEEREIVVPSGAVLEAAATVVEACCAAEGLKLSLRGSLSKYPGCTHWHYQRPKSKGTLEVTLWRGRIWLSIQSRRNADWIPGSAARLLEAIPRALSKPP